MKPFKRLGATSKFGGGDRNYGGKRFGGHGGGRDGGFGGRDGAPMMFKTVCAECGNEAEVPFKPNGRKPVLCRDCFHKDDQEPRAQFERGRSGGADFSAPRRESAPGSDAAVEKRLQEMDAKLDRILRELESFKQEKF